MSNFGYVVEVAVSKKHHDFIGPFITIDGSTDTALGARAWLTEQGYRETDEYPCMVECHYVFVKLNRRQEKEYAYIREMTHPS